MSKWPHSPPHEICGPGAYMLTAGTLAKEHFFHDQRRRDMLQQILIGALEDKGWKIAAWAVFSNHYHIVGETPETGLGLTELTKAIHIESATEANRLDGTPGRTVWYRCFDTKLTFQKSYLARLAYVHRNAVHHGLVREPEEYPWCSAGWFRLHAPRPFYETVLSFRTDRVNVYDPFDC